MPLEIFHQETLIGTMMGTALSFAISGSKLSKIKPYVPQARIGFIVGCAMLGSSYHAYREEKHRLKQLFLEDYIDKHPEDFPQFKNNQLLKDKIEPWGMHRT